MKKEYTVTPPKELLNLDEKTPVEEIAESVAILEAQNIERVAKEMLKKLGIENILEAQKLGYDFLVNREPGGAQRVQLVKLVDQVTIKVNVCTR